MRGLGLPSDDSPHSKQVDGRPQESSPSAAPVAPLQYRTCRHSLASRLATPHHVLLRVFLWVLFPVAISPYLISFSLDSRSTSRVLTLRIHEAHADSCPVSIMPPCRRSAHYARIVLAHTRMPTRVRMLCTLYGYAQSIAAGNGYLSIR